MSNLNRRDLLISTGAAALAFGTRAAAEDSTAAVGGSAPAQEPAPLKGDAASKLETLEAKNVIIGAGAMGSAAAYHLARRGEPVVLLEQFALGHDRGSSHGTARIISHFYADPGYARLLPEAFRAWNELEADAGEIIHIRTGGVLVGPPGGDNATRIIANLKEHKIPYWHASGREWSARHPAFSFPADFDVLYDPTAGMLAAARAVALEVELARRHGGNRTRIIENSPVRRIELDGQRPVVVTDSLRIVAERLIVSAGAWVKRLLPGLPVPLRPTLQQVLYFRAGDPSPFQIGRFPIFIYSGGTEDDIFYGMPEFLGMGVKVARHAGPDVDPDRKDRAVAEDYKAIVRHFLKSNIPQLADATIARTETCLYTVAPEGQFQLDFLPGRSDVIVASPCSGHGFKFSCLIGHALADLAAKGKTDVAIDPWKIKAPPAPASR
jgi:sarcosine oxidase